MTCSSNKKSWLFSDCGCGCKGKKQEQKFLISIMSALIFFIIANPDTFRLMRSIFGKWVSSPTGCPSAKGLMLHTLVFFLVVWGMMNIKRESFEVEGPSPDTQEEIVEEKVEPIPEEENEEEVEDEVIGPSAAPPQMVDMPLPLPGLEEDQFAMIDSGQMLEAMDLTEPTDLPPSGSTGKDDDEAVTCKCSNGRKVVMV